MDKLEKTGVPTKYSGDGLSHQDINRINSTTNSAVDASNYMITNFCNINDEINNYLKEFSLIEAIKVVPITRRKSGLEIRFLTSTNIYANYVYCSNSIEDDSWENEENWKPLINSIDGGTW